MMTARTLRNTLVTAAALLLAATVRPSAAASRADLPAALQEVPASELIRLFAVPFEPPCLPAEIARHRVWQSTVADAEQLVPAFVQVARRYPGTSDARRALMDIASIYVDKGDRAKGEAIFRYVMEEAKGRPEGRIAHLRLIEFRKEITPPPGVDPVAECQAAVEAYAGTPEEGLARLELGDLLVKAKRPIDGFVEYETVIARFPRQPYSTYARIRYAQGLMDREDWDEARAVLGPALKDPTWGGRAYWVRGETYARQGKRQQAISDLTRACATGDGTWVRGQAYLELARVSAAAGDFDKALGCYETYQRLSPPGRVQRLDIRIEVVRTLFAAKRYAEAAEAVLAVEAEVEAKPVDFYLWDDANKARALLDPIYDQCLAALAQPAAAPPAAKGKRSGPPARQRATRRTRRR